MRTLLFRFALGLVLGLAIVLIAIKMMFGRGQPYPDVSTKPLLGADAVEVIAESDWPPACVAVSEDGRVFYDLHAFGHPKRFGDSVLFEVVDGRSVPYPSLEAQKDLRAPFGLTVDKQNRLWTVESGGLEGFATRILAFDLASGDRVVEHTLPEGTGKFAQDLRVTPDGKTIILADTGLFRFTTPALLAVDADSGRVIRTFADHPSLKPQDYYIRRFDGQPHRLAYGLISFQVGVDGLSISPNGQWLYYATMSHGGLFRLRVDTLLDPEADVGATVEQVGTKPQSDGIEVDGAGTVIITDIKNHGVVQVDAKGRLQTLIKRPDIMWADSVALAPNGDIVLTDSAIPAYVQPLATPPPEAVLAQHRPYKVYRIRRQPRGSGQEKLFDDIWSELQTDLYDEQRAQKYLTEDRRQALRVRAQTAPDRRRLARDVVNPFLDELSVSHTHLFTDDDLSFYVLRSMFTYRDITRPIVSHIGVQLTSDYTIREVLDGYPAQKAGLRRGDRLLEVDGAPYRSIKAFRPSPQTVTVSRGDERLSVQLTPIADSPNEAMTKAIQESVMVQSKDGHRVGYVHLWTGTSTRALSHFMAAVTEDLATVDALILDLRGGYGGAWWPYLDAVYANRSEYFSFAITDPKGQVSPVQSAEPQDKPESLHRPCGRADQRRHSVR